MNNPHGLGRASRISSGKEISPSRVRSLMQPIDAVDLRGARGLLTRRQRRFLYLYEGGRFDLLEQEGFLDD